MLPFFDSSVTKFPSSFFSLSWWQWYFVICIYDNIVCDIFVSSFLTCTQDVVIVSTNTEVGKKPGLKKKKSVPVCRRRLKKLINKIEKNRSNFPAAADIFFLKFSGADFFPRPATPSAPLVSWTRSSFLLRVRRRGRGWRWPVWGPPDTGWAPCCPHVCSWTPAARRTMRRASSIEAYSQQWFCYYQI